MRRIVRLILDNLNLRTFLPLLALALLTTWYGLFWSKDHFESLTGGTTFFDMQPTLSVAVLFEQLGSYNDAAVSFYIGWVVFDYAWPFITFTTMLFITGWLLNFATDFWRSKFTFFVASAYLTVLMDWAENAGFLALVYAQPAEPVTLAQLTLALHGAKLFFNMVFNAAFWTLLLTVLYRRFRHQQENLT
jgi:hypothetical protein